MPDSPPRLRIAASNRLEVLAFQLADELRRQPAAPLAAEHIVVPHPALGGWLRLQLAAELGVVANLCVDLPAEFAWRAMRESVPELPAEQPFAPANLRWRIFESLGGDVEDAPLRRYLAGGDPRKRFDLADRLAQFYDRCLLYRPEWIRAWESGGERNAPHWQARLWQRLRKAADGAMHWVEAVDKYHARMAARTGASSRQADERTEGGGIGRVFFFGMVGLSPSYLEMLRAAANVMDVHLYLLSPCREFWEDIRSPRQRPIQTTADDHFFGGNELLAAWGHPAKDMQKLLAKELGTGAPVETYREPCQETRLAAVQRDILDLREAADSRGEAVLPMDDSLQIHVCHSAMREAEVLHDQLLGLFDAHADIQPADVLVLAPALNDYAPAIEAVFRAADKIPFNIGRMRRRDNAAVQAFLDLLALPGGRYGARDVLAPLRAASVQACFRIGDGELAEIGGWLGRAGIRWGIDGEHLRKLGAPATDSHTWRAGLRRLVLGYAMDDTILYKDVVPCALGHGAVNASSKDYECLGRFLRYCEQAFELAAWAEQARTPSQWTEDLRERVLAGFFADHATRGEIDAVARLVSAFAAECREAGCAAPVPFAVVRHVLNAAASKATRTMARLADGVTVAPLTAGSIHPAKVVCAIGMNDRAFPRHVPEATFDLIGSGGDKRRPGDRDRRHEDRFAFLEALLAARRCFLVTYTGRDQRDDVKLPPSVLVSELGEYLSKRFGDETQFGDETLTPHPLQPFDRRYFEDAGGPLFSYSEAMAAAANALVAQAEEPPDRFAGELPAVAERNAAQLDVDDLARFAAAPVRHFVERRLGMRLRMPEDDLEDEEVLEVDPLGAWQAHTELLALRDAGVPAATAQAVLRARGLLPPDALGVVAYRKHVAEVEALEAALASYEDHRAAAPVELAVAIADLVLVGAVRNYCPARRELLWWRVGKLRARDDIEAWLKLLAVTCATGESAQAILVGVAEGEADWKRLQGPAPAAAAESLAEWVAAWRAGGRAALPFFPKTSWAWASSEAQERQKKTLAAWRGNPWGEREDPYNALAFPQEPFVRDFEQWAERLLGPLAHTETGK